MRPLALAGPESTRSSNLAFALHCLPRSRRTAALVFYRFCRAVDDLADEQGMPPDVRRECLDRWMGALATGRGLPAELEEIIASHGLDRALLQAIVRGCLMDLDFSGFATLAALRDYCWHVACAVGLVSLRIFGCSPAAEPYAIHLGHALQLTNILRDVREDALRARVYLPTELFEGETPPVQEFLTQPTPERIRRALDRLAAAARERFALAEVGLPAEDRHPLLPARIMAALYSRLLERMASARFQSLESHWHLTIAEKTLLALRVIVCGR